VQNALAASKNVLKAEIVDFSAGRFLAKPATTSPISIADNMPKVTVVVPVFNEVATIQRAIASVSRQTLADFEIIVVDDASTDGSGEAVAKMGEPQLRLIRHGRTQGAAAARNSGIRAARGELIAFLDSDDEWLPDKLAIQVGAMASDVAPAATCTAFYLAHSDARVLRTPAARHGWQEEFLDGCFVSPGSTLMVRRDVYKKVGMLDESLMRFEDWEWLIRLVDGHRFECLSQPLAVVHAGASPSRAAVRAAGEILYARTAARIVRMTGGRGLSRLQATLQIECAVAAAREESHVLAGLHLLRAGIISPSRLTAFLQRMIGKMLECVR
jgi:glycosyltransferase involved in cell wall biosynthesis